MSKCTHNGIQQVWKIGKKGGIVLAGSRTQMEAGLHALGVDLVLNLCGSDVKGPFKLLNGAGSFLSEYTALRAPSPPTIEVDWPDGGVPKVGAAFWKDIVRVVTAGHKVAVYCLGGHGRTGTALVSIAHFAGRTGDLVKEVRDIYCESVVESGSQITYLKNFGVETEATGSHSFTSWSGGGVNYKGVGGDKGKDEGKGKGKALYDYPPGACKEGGKEYSSHRVAKGQGVCLGCGWKDPDFNHMKVLPPSPLTPEKGRVCQSGPHQGTFHVMVKEAGQSLFSCQHCGETEDRTPPPPLNPEDAVILYTPDQMVGTTTPLESGVRVKVEKVSGPCPGPDLKNEFPNHFVQVGETECRDCGLDLSQYFEAQGRKAAGDQLPSFPEGSLPS